MRYFPRKLLVAAAAVAGITSLAYGLTVPPSVDLRRVPWQTTTHYRWTINATDAFAGGVNTIPRIIGAVPPRAYVTRITCQVLTAWTNAGTGTGNTNLTVLSLASTSAASQAGEGDWLRGGIGVGRTCDLGLTSVVPQQITTPAGLGMAVTSGATPNGQTGGWDIYAKLYSPTGTPTVGQVVVIFEYVPDDDN